MSLAIQESAETEQTAQLSDHDKEMINKFEGTEPPKEEPEKTESKVEGLPEGFTTVEELAAKYNELQASLAAKPEGESEPKPEEQTPDLTVNTPPSMEKFIDEFTENGALTEESYTELQAKHGLTKEFVDGHIAAIQAQQELYTLKALDAVGGRDEYGKISAWAAVNLSAEELQAFNERVSRVGQDAITAVTELKAKYEGVKGKQPTLVNGDAKGASLVGYENWSQVQTDMADPRYAKDAAFRASVERKLSVSSFK